MIRTVALPDRVIVIDDADQSTLGHVSQIGDLWSAYVLTPIDDVHKDGKHVVPGIEDQVTAIELVVMMHAYWTLPAFEKEKET